MGGARWLQRREDYARAVTRLDEALAEPLTPIVRDALIQRFEFTVELAWKLLQAWLAEQGREVQTPREVLRAVFAAGAFGSAADADVWQRIVDDGNLTSHTYREALAIAIAQRIRDDYAARLQALARTAQAWR